MFFKAIIESKRFPTHTRTRLN